MEKTSRTQTKPMEEERTIQVAGSARVILEEGILLTIRTSRPSSVSINGREITIQSNLP